MKRTLLLFYLGIVANHGLSQDLNRHEVFIDMLSHAKDSLYTEILSKYDRHILTHPNDPKVQLERCKFIQNAYYDSYEDYNPNFVQSEECVQNLLSKFPDDPEVLIYAKEYLYGDTARVYLESLNEKIEADPQRWGAYSWQVYKLLAEEYTANLNDRDAIRFAEMAAQRNDTLDISLLLAQSYKNLSRNPEALEVLVNDLDSMDGAWDLNQKGRLFLELDEPEKALEAFRMARQKSADAEDRQSVAQAMIDNGLEEEARSYLVKDYRESAWNVSRPLRVLLEYDLEYANPDSAKTTYTRFVSENFWNDPVGIYRLKLFAKSPLSGWSFTDIGRVLILLVLIASTLAIPYLWILPIHYVGSYQKGKGKVFKESSFKWGLKHFWAVCSLWILCSLITDLLFNYTGYIAMFNPNIAPENFESISKVSADMTIFFFTGCLIFSIAFLKSQDIAMFLGKLKSNAGSIGVGIGLAFLLKIGLTIYVRILTEFGFDMDTGVSSIASINDSILSVIKYYNPYLAFLFVVLFVPFYEEVLFRGVFLSACERNMSFVFANIFQSLVFALIHQNIQYFLFYFAFGMIAGHFRNKTQSLITGTSMHMMNNLLVFIALMATR